jgi:hypothetical protein
MHLHVQHVSTYCIHHEAHRAFTVILLSAISPCTGECLHIGDVSYRYILILCHFVIICIKFKKKCYIHIFKIKMS